MPKLTRAEAEDLLFHEARLLDEMRLEEWLELFTEDGLYWLPINENKEPGEDTSLIYDLTVRRQERVYRLLSTPVPSQSPPSETVHCVTNVAVENGSEDGEARVHSIQLIYESRVGDYTQVGLGEQRCFVGRCEHRFRYEDGRWRIALKKLVLLNREASIPNLTFMV
jgi:3-phenylpropionate/cinnamic acid dioxygenase small subunit